MSQHRAAGDRVTPGNAARKPGAGRHSAKHRVARRNTPTSSQIVGLTAALAAAAGAVGFSHSSLASPTQANSAVNLAALSLDSGQQLSGITTARIQARQLATRDSSRVQLADTTKKQSAAAKLAQARAAKLNATQALTAKRASALATAKAKAEAAEQKARESATRCEMMISGYHITATFGQGGSRWARNHTGTDFAAPIGTRIGAVMKGVVIFADWAGAYGRQVQVRHEDGTVTWYNHMSKFSVSVGETVYAGDQVGAVGMTGNTTGPHLHFEVRPGGGEPINPMPWLRNHCGLNP
ncbi:murein DD-endopeptidase MepM/ murein hydrolase activator NlpD [Kribbella pratensis]|uniref:Murein DD-endopeptidase MepM/ murein hydrolase activator NlpD n=1 Tax=Kribbella pratensis TaxID=2512112 RepID=A0ABY2FJC0_9ACTN|nr:M23 family metallopeptidase [Kribbella pratensis]TDW91001.1 murein DD-endopeptidase MepM/ murein hydrolase activator NlpD [Kribbella pratensis]TDW98754.1 murein DD-endopeptidase MepM/ murein hydrolase activator NlpD [Kribbella sp. VKM Ac-2566]